MSPIVLWTCVALGIGTLVVRRRSVAIALMTVQSGVIGLAAVALAPGRSPDFLVASGVLILKAALLGLLLGYTVSRTRESTPVRASIGPLSRLGIGLSALLGANLLFPPMPFITPAVQQASISLIATGIAVVILRRATILQLVGILVAENGIALAAVALSGGMPIVIEVGALFDLTLVVSVAAAFHARIYAVLGSGNSGLLRDLRD